jgi:fatty acid-binding protein DegV
VGVTHANAPDEARAVAQELGTTFGTTDVFVAELGPVLGVHTGPGMIGAAVYARA